MQGGFSPAPKFPNETNYLFLIDFALRNANQELVDTSNLQWFLRGAGVVLASLLVGFLIARRIYHKRTNTGWA